jgi:hypothetical protein
MQGRNNTRRKRATQNKSEQQHKERANSSNARRATCSNKRQGEEKAEAMQSKEQVQQTKAKI